MSCFDTIRIRCPKCGEIVEFQTKIGNCWMEEYNQSRVPILLAAAIDGDVEKCPNCHTEVVARFVNKITTVAMHGVDLKEDSENDTEISVKNT